MQVIETYLYPNIVEVQILDSTIYHLRNRTVYSRPIKIYKGIDNPIQVIVYNQDNKPIPMDGYTVEAHIQDSTNKVTVKTYTVTFEDSVTGSGHILIDQPTLDDLDQRYYKLAFKLVKISDSTEQPMYTDVNFNVPIDLEVLPGYYPEL